MTQMPSEPGRKDTRNVTLGRIADELRRESERLRQLADELEAQEKTLAEMQANYPHLKQAVYAALRQQFERELPPLPDKDLEALAAEEGALPLGAFLDELEPPVERK